MKNPNKLTESEQIKLLETLRISDTCGLHMGLDQCLERYLRYTAYLIQKDTYTYGYKQQKTVIYQSLIILKPPLVVGFLKLLTPLYYHIPMNLQKDVITTLKY